MLSPHPFVELLIQAMTVRTGELRARDNSIIDHYDSPMDTGIAGEYASLKKELAS